MIDLKSGNTFSLEAEHAGRPGIIMLMRSIVHNPLMRAIASRLMPFAVRQRVASTLLPPPEVSSFRKMIAEPVEMIPVPGRVVLVCGSLQPGGAERQVVNTLEGLAGSRIESVTLLCDYIQDHANQKNSFYLPLALASGCMVREIAASGQKCDLDQLPPGFREAEAEISPALAADIANLFYEFRRLRPEIVHAWLDWSNVRAGLAAVMAGVPKVILSGRNLSPRHFALNTDYFLPAYAAMAERPADQLVFLNNSQAGASDYEEWLSMSVGRVTVLRNGVRLADAQRPSPAHNRSFRASHGIPHDVPVIGGMFRFNLEKRPLLWIEAATKISARFPQAHFVLFGNGTMRSEMESLIQAEGIGSRTHLCDLITPSLAGLAPCDLILLTSSGEGTPNVLLEAQWLGLPVVTTNAGGAAEAVLNGVTGMVVEGDNAQVIADAVISILEDRSFQERARKEGPPFIASRYGMERMIEETLAAYGFNKVGCESTAQEVGTHEL